MVAVFATKCQSGTALCDTIDFSDRRDLHSTLDPRSPSTRLENKASKSQLLTIEAKQNPFFIPKSRVDTHKMGLGSAIH